MLLDILRSVKVKMKEKLDDKAIFQLNNQFSMGNCNSFKNGHS